MFHNSASARAQPSRRTSSQLRVAVIRWRDCASRVEMQTRVHAGVPRVAVLCRCFSSVSPPTPPQSGLLGARTLGLGRRSWSPAAVVGRRCGVVSPRFSPGGCVSPTLSFGSGSVSSPPWSLLSAWIYAFPPRRPGRGSCLPLPLGRRACVVPSPLSGGGVSSPPLVAVRVGFVSSLSPSGSEWRCPSFPPSSGSGFVSSSPPSSSLGRGCVLPVRRRGRGCVSPSFRSFPAVVVFRRGRGLCLPPPSPGSGRCLPLASRRVCVAPPGWGGVAPPSLSVGGGALPRRRCPAGVCLPRPYWPAGGGTRPPVRGVVCPGSVVWVKAVSSLPFGRRARVVPSPFSGRGWSSPPSMGAVSAVPPSAGACCPAASPSVGGVSPPTWVLSGGGCVFPAVVVRRGCLPPWVGAAVCPRRAYCRFGGGVSRRWWGRCSPPLPSYSRYPGVRGHSPPRVGVKVGPSFSPRLWRGSRSYPPPSFSTSPSRPMFEVAGEPNLPPPLSSTSLSDKRRAGEEALGTAESLSRSAESRCAPPVSSHIGPRVTAAAAIAATTAMTAASPLAVSLPPPPPPPTPTPPPRPPTQPPPVPGGL